MSHNEAERLHGYINTMLNLFLVNEQRFPSAQGKMRYNPLDFQILRHVARFPDCRGVDIAKALSVAPTTLQSGLDRLIRSDLILRTSDPEDGRAKRHRLTHQGEEVRAAILQQDLQNMNFLLDQLNARERDQLLHILGKIDARIAALAGAPD